MIRNAVIHLTNEQPMLADLFDTPTVTDTQLVCTNLRSMNGKRPVFVDDSASVFIFPVSQIRFIEIPPGAHSGSEVSKGGTADAGTPSSNGSGPVTEGEQDLDLDEDFLRRVREA